MNDFAIKSFFFWICRPGKNGATRKTTSIDVHTGWMHMGTPSELTQTPFPVRACCSSRPGADERAAGIGKMSLFWQPLLRVAGKKIVESFLIFFYPAVPGRVSAFTDGKERCFSPA